MQCLWKKRIIHGRVGQRTMPDSDVYEQTTHLSEGHVRHDALSDSDPQIS